MLSFFYLVSHTYSISFKGWNQMKIFPATCSFKWIFNLSKQYHIFKARYLNIFELKWIFLILICFLCFQIFERYSSTIVTVINGIFDASVSLTAIPLLAYHNGVSLEIIGYSFLAILGVYWLRTIFLSPKMNIPVGSDAEDYNLSQVWPIESIRSRPKILNEYLRWGQFWWTIMVLLSNKFGHKIYRKSFWSRNICI